MFAFNFLAIIGIVAAIIICQKNERHDIRKIPVYIFLGLITLDLLAFFLKFPFILKGLGIYFGIILGIFLVSLLVSVPAWGGLALISKLARLLTNDE